MGFAEPEAAVAPANPADRRGPFRPQMLISTRSRLHGETIARTFQVADACVILAVTWAVFDYANPAGVLGSSIGAVAPMLAPALMLIVVSGGSALGALIRTLTPGTELARFLCECALWSIMVVVIASPLANARLRARLNESVPT